jgi:hypothetical protein
MTTTQIASQIPTKADWIEDGITRCWTCGTADFADGVFLTGHGSEKVRVCLACGERHELRGYPTHLHLDFNQRTIAAQWDGAGIGGN